MSIDAGGQVAIFTHFCGHWDRFVLWVDLPVQRRLCQIFVSGVRLPAFKSILRVDGLSTDPRVLGCHNIYDVAA